ncbi:MAG: right-handed parallel beta-helix repeat-containing protein [Rhodocyclaceae bacterium]
MRTTAEMVFIPMMPTGAQWRRLAVAAAWLALALPAPAAPPLQPLIDATPAGGTLRPRAGTYAGPAVIDRPMTIEGGGRVTLDGGNRGTVLTVRASGATVRGLHLTGGGDTHDGIDAGVMLAGDDNVLEDNVIDAVLFGIHLRQGNRNRILNNRVTGRPRSLAMRGDGIRLWNSRNNLIRGNRFERVRDLAFTNSPDNRIVENRLKDGRYGMQIVFSPRLEVSGNRISHTATGIVALYSPNLVLRGNRVAHALAGGGGIVFKESDDGLVEGNEIVHCAVGLLVDAPPEPIGVLTVRGNRFAHNVAGVHFYGEKGGHRLENNRFEHNLTQVTVSAAGAGSDNVWRGNAWSDYQGFDRDGDGIGDTPHEIRLYADRIWMELPKAKFFANSPAFELLDFLERLAPFSAPALIARDSEPRLRR